MPDMKKEEGWKNQLWYGDNLDVLRKIPNDYVDLIYLDPPFNSNASYNMLFKEKDGTSSQAQTHAFEDTWNWNGNKAEEVFDELIETCGNNRLVKQMQSLRTFVGDNNLMAYLTMMAIRLKELHRVLKPTGSLYLHCDPTASHYIKLVLDAVFGHENFKNEVIWSYKKWAVAESIFSRNHDVLFFYAKSIANNKFNVLLQSRAASTLKRFGNKKIVSGFNENGKRVPSQTIDEESEGVKMADVWEIPIIAPSSKERMGYPTQKPEALLERIIKASSNEGDIVLDPFCGCGTAVVVAEKLHRKWIGIDITYLAIKLIRERLEKTFTAELSPFVVEGVPKDIASAIEMATTTKKGRFQFEWWALDMVGADYAGEKKMGADKGLDGIKMFKDDPRQPHKKVIFQVKSGHVQFAYIQQLKGAMKDEEAEIGVLITLEEPTKPMINEAAKEGFYVSPLYPDRKFPRIQILTIEDIFNGKKPEYPISLSMDMYKQASKQEKSKSDENKLFER